MIKSEIPSAKSETNSNYQNIKVQKCKPCRISKIPHSKFVSPLLRIKLRRAGRIFLRGISVVHSSVFVISSFWY